VVLAVALDVEGARTVKPFVKAQKLTYPILLDPGLRVAERYRVLGPPLTFLIGPQGEAIGIAPGPREWAGEKAMALIRQLLDSSRAKQPR